MIFKRIKGANFPWENQYRGIQGNYWDIAESDELKLVLIAQFQLLQMQISRQENAQSPVYDCIIGVSV